jgi:hypothetical protein
MFGAYLPAFGRRKSAGNYGKIQGIGSGHWGNLDRLGCCLSNSGADSRLPRPDVTSPSGNCAVFLEFSLRNSQKWPWLRVIFGYLYNGDLEPTSILILIPPPGSHRNHRCRN